MTPDNQRILERFGLTPADLLGEGGESFVYALGDAHVLRLPHQKKFDAQSRTRLKVFLELIAGRLPFATPEIEEIGPSETYTIERRLPGRSMSELLRTLDDDRRDKAFRNYVAAMDAINAIALPTLPYGHILAKAPVTAKDWRAFARESLARFRGRNRVTIAKEVGDPYRLFDKAADMIADLPELPAKVLVHGDYFPGNVLLADDLSVSAVLDFGVFTVVGDPRLDLAISYLTLELIEECTADDARFVRELVIERHGAEIAPALRFYRAFLAFSMADPANAAPPYPKLYGWSIAMLKLLSEDRLPP
jgi:aminoglycoside phosphotransferase (APT) family kinase protein